MPRISVIIPVLNGATTIRDQIDAVRQQSCSVPFEIVVADHGSTDETVEIVQALSSSDGRISMADASTAPRGLGAPKNVGARAARSPLLAFCDADDLVAPGWLEAIYQGLLNDPVVLARCEYWKLNPHLEGERRQYDGEQFFEGVPVLSSGAFGIRRDLLLGIGGFSETFPRAVDTEFALRLYEGHGHKPVLLHGAIVHVRARVGGTALFRRNRAMARARTELQRRLGVTIATRWRPLTSRLLLLVRLAPRLFTAAGRDQWTRAAGSLIGELEGHLRSPFLPPQVDPKSTGSVGDQERRELR